MAGKKKYIIKKEEEEEEREIEIVRGNASAANVMDEPEAQQGRGMYHSTTVQRARRVSLSSSQLTHII